MMEQIKVKELCFLNPDEIQPGLQTFFDSNPHIDVLDISHTVVAVQKPAQSFSIAGNNQPQIEYQFRYFVVYVT